MSFGLEFAAFRTFDATQHNDGFFPQKQQAFAAGLARFSHHRCQSIPDLTTAHKSVRRDRLLRPSLRAFARAEEAFIRPDTLPEIPT